MTLQIDVIKKMDPPFEHLIQCNLYADGPVVKIYMHESNYQLLMREGFFIRNGLTEDSAGVMNTTVEYWHEKD